ncbi:sigma-E factor negative regulatory protein [Thalassotalea ganghwensis]
MNNAKFENVSSLIDDEQLSDDSIEHALNEQELSEAWSRYHFIGDVMRDEVSDQIPVDMSASIAAAIAEEPTVLAPKQTSGFRDAVKAQVIKLVKPFGQVAIAASAAGLMVVGVQQNVANNDVVSPSQVVKTTPLGGFAEPVSLNFQNSANKRSEQEQSIAEQQRRFQALLHDHQQQLKLSAVISETEQSENKAEDTPK